MKDVLCWTQEVARVSFASSCVFIHSQCEVGFVGDQPGATQLFDKQLN